MGIFPVGRRVRPKRFSYEPRFYNPEKHDNLRRRMQVGRRTTRRRSKSNLITLAFLLAFAAYIYIVLM